MYTPTMVEGQELSNRVRKNLYAIGKARKLSPAAGLNTFSSSGMWKFQTGQSDITLAKLSAVAEELGISPFELLAPPKETLDGVS